MVSLFLGELYRASSTAENCACPLRSLNRVPVQRRTHLYSKCRLPRNDGIEIISNWHDPLGLTVLAICLLLFWGFARLVSGPLPKLLAFEGGTRANPCPWRWASGLGAWSCLPSSPPKFGTRPTKQKTSANGPSYGQTSRRDFRDVAIPKPEAMHWHATKGRGAAWANDDGSRSEGVFFKWAEGPIRPGFLLACTGPKIACLQPGIRFARTEAQSPLKLRTS